MIALPSLNNLSIKWYGIAYRLQPYPNVTFIYYARVVVVVMVVYDFIPSQSESIIVRNCIYSIEWIGLDWIEL